MNLAYLWSRARIVINKNRNIFRYHALNLLKFWFLFLVSTKEQKRDKNEFVTKFVEIIVTVIAKQKSLSKSLWNLCYTVFFHRSLETQNHKQNNFVQSPILTNYVHINWRAFQLLSYFWSNLNYPNLIYQLLFCKRNVKKTV